MTNNKKYLLFFGIAAGICYGTLFPLTGWDSSQGQPFAQLLAGGGRLSFGDLAVNVIVYVPVGWAFAFAFSGLSSLRAVSLATLVAATLSLCLELAQTYLPGRVSSITDLALNTLGGMMGAVVAQSMVPSGALGKYFYRIRDEYFNPTREAKLGLLIIGLWVTSQLVPFVPSLDWGNIKNGFKPLVHVLTGEQTFSLMQMLEYALASYVLASITFDSLQPGTRRSRKVLSFFIVVLGLKVLIISRQLSLEATFGTISGIALFQISRAIATRPQSLPILSSILLGILIAATQSGPKSIANDNIFNWIPFGGHVTNDLIGIADLIGSLWPMAAFAWWQLRFLDSPRKLDMTVGALALALGIFALEWNQTTIVGRLGDITDVLISVAAYLGTWAFVSSLADSDVQANPLGHKSSRRKKRRRKTPAHIRLLFGFSLLTTIIFVGGYLATLPATKIEERLDESRLYEIPVPRDLPPVRFDDFHYEHPRLPHPTEADYARLEKEYPKFLKNQLSRANEGSGQSNAIIFSEHHQPGSQDLEPLYQKLLNLEFISRGNGQVKPLVVAYDWLHTSWSEEQKQNLLNKTLDGCEFIVSVIREKRLSPYNVYLYNSPMQALMACAIATYGDDPRSENVMRFTADMWKNRIQPVWRQIMGNSGGWHEGGEYVGLGIGQAIYQLPNMWRQATGEDAFRSVPGIKGFLDFSVYRTRPDGTHFRWGDAGFFNKKLPDVSALAVEFQHAAAYTANGCEKRLVTQTWPWGPLAEESLCDESAEHEMPWTKLFDGLGLLVARSSWNDDATYVTFKAGDNYWSHSHLDQGGFTIFKHRALAIDSGIYGTGYNSEHHMNYAYQTVAHNTITVTDPSDIVPAPKDESFRAFANDGGQRRIGSGWGIEAAPVDFEEWTQKKEIYETGDILEFVDTGLTVSVLADITAAYTNRFSGKGTFSHRTLRVKHAQRRFFYDREMDLIVVFDDVETIDPNFVVRWNLHMLDRPVRSETGFTMAVRETVEGSFVKTTAAGLTAEVLLPEKNYLNIIGGPGMEFFVDGINYDQGGEVHKVQARRKNLEAGEWRVEIIPNQGDKHTRFLVMLSPWTNGEAPKLSRSCVIAETLMNCKVEKNGKSAEYSFFKKNLDIQVEHL